MSRNFFNRTLDQRIVDRVKKGRHVPAIVLDYFNGRATVKLGYTGATMRNLKVIGGPVEANDLVDVDYTTEEPTVVALSKEWMTEDDVRSIFDEISGQDISQELIMTIVVFSGGSVKDLYSPDALGLDAAISDANEGDVIYLPDVDITASITVPDEVSIVGVSSRQSIIRGVITMDPASTKSCSLENLSLLHGEYTQNEVSALVIDGAGTAYIKNCEIHGYNCYSGRANAVEMLASTVTAVFKNSTVIADSNSGTAYAFKGITSGDCNILDCFIYGKTGMYDGNGLYVHGNVEAFSEIDRGCITLPTTEDDNYRAVHTSGNALRGIMSAFRAIDGALTSPDTPYNFHTHGTSSHPGTIIRNGNYLYVRDMSPSSNYYIREYDITDWSYTNLLVIYSSSPVSVLEFSLVGDRQLIVAQPDNGEGDYGAIYLADFSTSTVTLEEEVDYSDYRTLPNTDGITMRSPSINMAVLTPDDEVVCIIAGIYYEYISFENNWYGMYTWSKNITQDTGWEISFKLFSETNYDTDEPYLYAMPAVVRNEKVVFAISQGFNVNSYDQNNRYAYVAVFDIYEQDFDYLIQTVASPTYDETIMYFAVPNNNDGVAFLTVWYGNDTNYISVWMVDPYAMTLDDDYWVDAESANEVAFASRTKAYVMFGSPGTMYLLTRDAHTSLWSGWTVPTGFWNNHDNTVDDSDRIWYFSGGYIYGLLVSDKSDIDSFSVSGITGYNFTDVIAMGGFLVVVDHDVSGSNCYFFTIEETTGS